MDTQSLLIQLVQAMAMPIILGILSLLVPYRKTAYFRPLSPREIQVIEKAVRINNWLGLLFSFAIIALLSWLTYDFLKTLYRLLPKPTDGFTHAFTFDETFWLGPAICLGFGAASPVLIASGNWFYGVRRYALINHAYNQQYGINGAGIFRWMTWLAVGIGMVAIGLVYTFYAGIQGEQVVINQLTEIRERRYPIQEITRLTYVDYRIIYAHKQDRLAYYELAFRDGYIWNTHEALRNVPLTSDGPIIQYLSQKTGIRVDSTQRSKVMKN